MRAALASTAAVILLVLPTPVAAAPGSVAPAPVPPASAAPVPAASSSARAVPAASGSARAVLAAPGSAAAVPAGAPVFAAAAGPAPLGAELDRILGDPRLAGATVALDVRDTAGTVVHQREPDRRVLPASTQKLLTAAAALEILGPGHRFRTTVRTAGSILHLHGGGDPTMTYARFDRLAATVAKAGPKRYAGLVADDSWFDRVPLGLDWSWQDEPYAHTAPISALTFAANDRYDNAAVEIRYRGVAGRPPTVRVWPPDGGVRVINQAVTEGSADTVDAVRAHGTGTVTVRGAVPAGRSGTVLVSVPDPAATAAGLFRAALRRHGVTVAGRTITGPVPGTARTLTAHSSPPLTEILPSLLKHSTNGVAELLVKAMSRAVYPDRPGTWPAGLTAATGALGRLGVDTRLLTMGDGSGLSRRNWVTARHLTTLLTAARHRPWFPAFHAALPVAGNSDPAVGGTLRDRMGGTAAAGNVRAKTGTLTGVHALAGYVTDGSGRRLVFAVVVNNAVTGVADLVDQVAVTLAGPPHT